MSAAPPAAPLAVVILAAGQGTRMKSALPKPLHEAAGRPLVEHVVRAALPLEPDKLIVVVGHGAELVKARLDEYPMTFVTQTEQRGTGHALLETKEALQGFEGRILVLNGDGPLLRTETLRALLDTPNSSGGMSLLVCEVADPTGLGRIVREEGSGDVTRIVEEKDATPPERAIREVNPGIYVFGPEVFALAGGLSSANAAGEYYLTDLVSLYLTAGRAVRAVRVDDETEVLGVNDRRHLAHIDRLLRERVRDRWLLAGVTMIAPEQIFIDDTVLLAPDVTLYPGVWLRGETVVGGGAVVGPCAHLENCRVAEGAVVAPHTVMRNEHIT